MSTKNHRVAAYLPQEIHDRLEAFKAERQIKGDSQALIIILSEFLGVSQYIAHQGEPLVNKHEFEDRLLQIRSELLGELSSELSRNLDMFQGLLGKVQAIDDRLKTLESTKAVGSTLSTGELAKRLKIDGSTLSHWKSAGKKGKSPDELLKATREKDPDGIGWLVVPETGKFKPERDLPSSNSNSMLQGELLHVEPSNQVNPLPEGSERSGEG
jgi:hypothetical protein